MRSLDGIAALSLFSSGVRPPSRANHRDRFRRRTAMKMAMDVRVWTQRQAQTQTISQPFALLRESRHKQGWGWNQEDILRDDGYRGARLRRPGLDRLREHVRHAAFDPVLVSAPERLARNCVHQMLLMEDFEPGGCQMECLDQPINHNPHDQLVV
jgi:site-specific DNA recombinase